MKIEVKITDEEGNIFEYEVNDSLISSKSIHLESLNYQKSSANKLLVERVAFGQGALWVRSLILKDKE